MSILISSLAVAAVLVAAVVIVAVTKSAAKPVPAPTPAPVPPLPPQPNLSAAGKLAIELATVGTPEADNAKNLPVTNPFAGANPPGSIPPS